MISIHGPLAEPDMSFQNNAKDALIFQSTGPSRSPTGGFLEVTASDAISIHGPLAEPDRHDKPCDLLGSISIHGPLAEPDT